MIDINPDLAWYTEQSKSAGLSPRCQYANIHRCPRYYASLYLLGEVGITTKIDKEKVEQLDKQWDDLELMPVINEHDTGIGSSGGAAENFNNFCPELTFDIFGFFATSLYKYSDEIDKDVSHRQLENKGVSGDNWRWQWAYIDPMHYINCPLYTQILSKPMEIDNNKPKEDKNEEIVTLKPSIFGMSINLKALLQKFKS